jgi:hypothetical protein
MTLCAKVDWLTIDGHIMRRKRIGLATDEEGLKFISDTKDELEKLPHFKEFFLIQLHDDKGEHP